ncbi:MAG TPA: hypothetical protein VMY42_16475 [Thermoguttaceae bacterium]|nr:hypothetical protein [Thermoguttaceae bacterium]
MTIVKSAACAILVLACPGVSAQDYEIRMSRPMKVGEKYELTASGSKSKRMTTSVQGQVVKEDKSSFTAKLEGTITVLEVDERGQEQKITLTVSKCVMSVNGDADEKEALTEGTEVVAQLRDGEEVFLIDDKPAPSDIEEMLDLFSTLPTTKVTGDDMFGTKERKKVGDSWAINSTAAARGFDAGKGTKVEPENIKGSTKLEKVLVVDGSKCLQLLGRMEISEFVLPMPPGFSVEKANVSLDSLGELPVDTSIGHLSQAMNMTMTVSIKGKPSPDAPEVTISVSVAMSKQEKRKLLK